MKNNLSKTPGANVNNYNGLILDSVKNVDEIAMIDIELTKKMFENNLSALKKMSSADNSPDIFDLSSEIAVDSMECLFNNCLALYEAMAITQKVIGHMLEESLDVNFQNTLTRLSMLNNFSAI